MARSIKDIFVYAHWTGMSEPVIIGILSISHVRGKEIFSFEYDPSWLNSSRRYFLDPDLHYYSGPQYTQLEKSNFGLFLDSSPDRWGRVLMKRREALDAQLEKRSECQLMESDFLPDITLF